MPSLVRLKRDVEAEPPVGGDSLARCTRHRGCHGTVKIPVRIRGANPLPRLRPFSGDLAAAYDVARLHLEDVGEVASKGDLELKPHRLHAVVGDVEIFVQAAADRSADGEAEGARENRAVFGRDGLVGEEDTCRVIADRASVEQLPRLAVGVNRPTADNPRVEEVQALVARPSDPPVRLADEHGLPLVDGNLRWTNLNLERHDVRLMVVWSSRARAVARDRYRAGSKPFR